MVHLYAVYTCAFFSKAICVFRLWCSTCRSPAVQVSLSVTMILMSVCNLPLLMINATH
jgi:hypothetical protein